MGYLKGMCLAIGVLRFEVDMVRDSIHEGGGVGRNNDRENRRKKDKENDLTASTQNGKVKMSD